MSEEERPSGMLQKLKSLLTKSNPPAREENKILIYNSRVSDVIDSIRQVTFRFEKEENREEIRNIFEKISDFHCSFIFDNKDKNLSPKEIIEIGDYLNKISEEMPKLLRQAAEFINIDDNWELIRGRGLTMAINKPEVFGRFADDMKAVFGSGKQNAVDALNDLAADIENNKAGYAKALGLSSSSVGMKL